MQKSKRSSFSLFLTRARIPADPHRDSRSGKIQLIRCLETNLADSEVQAFNIGFRQRYPGYRGGSNRAYNTMPYHDFLLVTVPKLVIKSGLDEWFAVTCEEKLTYVGQGHTTRMVSFCFECDYIGLPTGYGSRPQTAALQNQYLQNVVNVIKKPYVDINQLLAANSGLRTKYSGIRTQARVYYGKKLV